MNLNRARFLAALFASALLPQITQAQSARRPARIGLLGQFPLKPQNPYGEALLETLQVRGLHEGRDFIIESRTSPDHDARFPALALDLVAQNVDLIIACSTMAAISAHRATGTIPIVACPASNPTRFGLATSMARPGGNLTGMSDASLDHAPQIMQAMKDSFPDRRRPAVLWNSENPCISLQMQEANLPAIRALGLTPIAIDVRSSADLDAAIATIHREGADMIFPFSTMFAYTERLLEVSRQNRIPIFGPGRFFAEAGAVASYGPDYFEMHRTAGRYVADILRGGKPAEMPIQEPTRWETVVNMAAAKKLGIEIGPLGLARATEIID